MNTQFEWLIEEEGESYKPHIEAALKPLRAVLRHACLVLLAILCIALLAAWGDCPEGMSKPLNVRTSKRRTRDSARSVTGSAS